jgi:hypothetical protein
MEVRALTSPQSKTLMGLFKEAREAYRERKSEIHATRAAELEEKRARRAFARARLGDSHSVASSRRSKSRRDGHQKHDRHERGDHGHRHHGDLARRHTAASPTSPNFWAGENPDYYGELDRSLPPTPTRHRTSPDLDLAYGYSPPQSPVPTDDEAELASLLTKVNFILDEAHCLQHSATKTISTLQKNPDALAAVGLALAEISNLVIKMAPGALAALKGGFPAIFAILASPQFMIAAGVGVGITVVALGGFKIIKKIQERNTPSPDGGMAHLEQIDVSNIDRWRRGIADAEAESIGTSVDGEFITPEANAIRHAVEAQYDRRAGMRDRGRRRASSLDGDTMTMMSSPSERGVGREKKDKDKKGKKDKKEKKEKEKKDKGDKMNKVVALFKHGNSVIV